MPDDVNAVDGSFLRLSIAGWSIIDEAIAGPDGPTWRVIGTNGRGRIRAEATTRDAALWAAVEQAAVGITEARLRPQEKGHRM